MELCKTSWRDVYMYMVELVDRMCDELGEPVDGAQTGDFTSCYSLRSKVEDFATSLPKCNSAWEVLQHFHNLMRSVDLLYYDHIYRNNAPWRRIAEYTGKIVNVAVDAVVRRILELYCDQPPAGAELKHAQRRRQTSGGEP